MGLQRLCFSSLELRYILLDFNSRKNGNIWRIERDGISAIKLKQLEYTFRSHIRRCCLSFLLSMTCAPICFPGKMRHVIMLNLFIGWFNLRAKDKFRQLSLAQQSSINLSCCKHPFLLHFFVTIFLPEDILPVNYWYISELLLSRSFLKSEELREIFFSVSKTLRNTTMCSVVGAKFSVRAVYMLS